MRDQLSVVYVDHKARQRAPSQQKRSQQVEEFGIRQLPAALGNDLASALEYSRFDKGDERAPGSHPMLRRIHHAPYLQLERQPVEDIVAVVFGLVSTWRMVARVHGRPRSVRLPSRFKRMAISASCTPCSTKSLYVSDRLHLLGRPRNQNQAVSL